ncbi:MAG TPA: hypothetical protein PLI86_08195, partial [bacterium]|nr:hypothetical protein [bacterium]
MEPRLEFTPELEQEIRNELRRGMFQTAIFLTIRQMRDTYNLSLRNYHRSGSPSITRSFACSSDLPPAPPGRPSRDCGTGISRTPRTPAQPPVSCANPRHGPRAGAAAGAPGPPTCYTTHAMSDSPEIAEYLSPSAALLIREAVAGAGGNEVFFLGKTGPELLVEQAAVLARGDGESVPAILRKVAAGDVVVHNHPDGLLLPSKADLAIAAEVGNRGAGFYIVDNKVERIYAVVEPSPKEERAPLDFAQLRRYVVPGGPVSTALRDYEYRLEQAQMMEQVASA